MFTGIVEATGQVREITHAGTNKSFWIESPLSPGFRIDQSVCHDGVCLTVEEVSGTLHRVTAIRETLQKTSLGSWEIGTVVNLEQSLRVDSRLDGHFVQGHADTTGTCTRKRDQQGSTELTFRFPKKFAELVIEKGSIAVNGVSLTIFNVKKSAFTVAIIPYTLEHTNLMQVGKGSVVNLEFDMLGKYMQRRLSLKG
ncbi:MAG TPA: riboflavin synthase [Flavisolibacter sp.]